MKISCDVTEDLLPLYADDSCSDDSKKLLEEHLKECASCQKKYERMKNQDFFMELEDEENNFDNHIISYTKKIYRYRMAMKVLIPVLIVIVGFTLSVTYEASKLMLQQTSGKFGLVEKGVFDLTQNELNCSVDEIEEYTFYTSSTRIIVNLSKMPSEKNAIVKLWKKSDLNEEIMVSEVEGGKGECLFTNLLPGELYSITIEGVTTGNVTISESLNFRQAVFLVIRDMF